MNKFFIILFHTFLTKIKSKSFIVSTLITVLIVGGITNIDRVIGFFDDNDEAAIIAVSDETDELYPVMQEYAKGYSEQFVLKETTDGSDDAEEKVSRGEYDGLLILSYGDDGLPQGRYKAMSVAEQAVPMQLEQVLQQLKVMTAADRLGVEHDQLEAVFALVTFEQEAISDTARSEDELNTARFLVNILVVVIYFSVIGYGNMIAMEVATEKSSRVMEILVSSVSPVKQLFAKILAIAMLGIVQFILIISVGYLSIRDNMASGGMVSEFMSFDELPADLITYAFIFFLLGYLFYATISAVLGSLVSRIEDVNQLITPLTLLIVVAFMISIFGLNSPESTFITAASYIPFFTPMVMFLRFGMLQLPAWEMAAGIGIMIASIAVLAILGARVYRGGVLLYGKSSSLKDIKQALILSKKEK